MPKPSAVFRPSAPLGIPRPAGASARRSHGAWPVHPLPDRGNLAPIDRFERFRNRLSDWPESRSGIARGHVRTRSHEFFRRRFIDRCFFLGLFRLSRDVLRGRPRTHPGSRAQRRLGGPTALGAPLPLRRHRVLGEVPPRHASALNRGSARPASDGPPTQCAPWIWRPEEAPCPFDRYGREAAASVISIDLATSSPHESHNSPRW